jgi:hypothetical protein
VVWGFFKLITPFIDPLTREKLKFNEDMNQYVPSEQLWTEFNGKLDFEYDHSVYWPALQKLCGERREQRKAKWIAGGKHIGEYEDFLGGALPQGVGSPAAIEVVNTEESTTNGERKTDETDVKDVKKAESKEPEVEKTEDKAEEKPEEKSEEKKPEDKKPEEKKTEA